MSSDAEKPQHLLLTFKVRDYKDEDIERYKSTVVTGGRHWEFGIKIQRESGLKVGYLTCNDMNEADGTFFGIQLHGMSTERGTGHPNFATYRKFTYAKARRGYLEFESNQCRLEYWLENGADMIADVIVFPPLYFEKIMQKDQIPIGWVWDDIANLLSSAYHTKRRSFREHDSPQVQAEISRYQLGDILDNIMHFRLNKPELGPRLVPNSLQNLDSNVITLD